MARPKKYRNVCHFPQTQGFVPIDGGGAAAVLLTVDEYEAVRLIDKECLSQEQCGRQMGIARTTVQWIYSSARKKLADALVDGLPLRIEGGEYQLCGGEREFRSCGGCYKYQIRQQYTKAKGEHMMRIAVTYEAGKIFQHFGHTGQFKVYDVEAGEIKASEVVDTDGQGHGALAGVLKALGVDALICGGIGGGARAALEASGIQLYGGVTGEADEAVAALLRGGLAYDPDVRCSHHQQGEDHHNCGHHQQGQCRGHQSCQG